MNRCTRPCCSPRPYPRVRVHDQPTKFIDMRVPVTEQPTRPPWGLIFVLVAIFAGLIVAAVTEPSDQACGTPPPNAYRSAGLWYSGSSIIGQVDPYHPDCFPKP